MQTPLRVLLIEDSEDDVVLNVEKLRQDGYQPAFERVETAAELEAALERQPWDVILSDYRLPGFSGLDALEIVKAGRRDIPFIMVSGTIGEEEAAKVIRSGACDYILKDRLGRLGRAVGHALVEKRLRDESAQAERQLQLTHQTLQHLLAHSPAVIYSLKVEGDSVTPTMVSENVTRLLGFTVKESSSYAWWAGRLHDDDRERAMASIPETIARGELTIEYRLRHKGGHYVWVEDNRRTIRDAAGSPTEIAGVWADITERKRNENVLRESERRFRELLENLDLIAMTLDRSGNIMFCNNHLLRLTGWRREEVVGANWFSMFITDADQSTISTFRKGIASGHIPAHHSNPIKTRSGTLLEISWNNVILRDEAGRIAGTASIGEDVTDRKLAEANRLHLEAQLRQSQKLESIGTLASGVAHEINNPIMGIMNYAQLIGDKLESQDPNAGYAAEIAKLAERVAEIVKNLLSFARSDRQARSRAHMCDIVESTLSLVRTVLRRDQVTLVVEVPQTLPAVACRTQQIQQVIMNLLTNARDALVEKGRAEDGDRRIIITARSLDRDGRAWVRTTVEDHGMGIPEALRERIFDPFFTTKPRDVGTGLGLSVSHGIVVDHEGALTFESEVGKWTRFHLDLPAEVPGKA